MGVETTREGGGRGAWALRSEARGAGHPCLMEGPAMMLMKATAGFRQRRSAPRSEAHDYPKNHLSLWGQTT